MEEFYTGRFRFSENRILDVVHNCHYSEEEEYDYDPSSDPDFSFPPFECIDGYVSNVGKTVTIHINDEFNTEKNVEFIKRCFHLGEGSGLTAVYVIPFEGVEYEK